MIERVKDIWEKLEDLLSTKSFTFVKAIWHIGWTLFVV